MREDRLFPVATGTVAALFLMAFYLSIVTLAEGRPQAREQFLEDLPYLVFLFPGFGAQVGIYSHVRLLTARIKAGAVAGSAGGVSATAVVACCAHFVPTLLPVVGVSAVSSALAAWKAPLLLLAIGMNLAGLAYMLHALRQHRAMLQAAA